jgi:hypothetical protein
MNANEVVTLSTLTMAMAIEGESLYVSTVLNRLPELMMNVTWERHNAEDCLQSHQCFDWVKFFELKFQAGSS